MAFIFFFSSRRRHTRWNCDWSSDVCSSDLVEFVERGETTGPEILAVATDYLAPLLAAEIDTLILGCTHYPLLTGVIGYLTGPDVFLVNSAEWVARGVFAELTRADLHAPYGNQPRH